MPTLIRRYFFDMNASTMRNSPKSQPSFFLRLLSLFGVEKGDIHGETVVSLPGASRIDHARLIFKGWNNQSRQRLYHQDVHFLLNASSRERERELDVGFEEWPKGVVLMDMKEDGRLRVAFDPKKVTLAKILEYLERIGVNMEAEGEAVSFPG